MCITAEWVSCVILTVTAIIALWQLGKIIENQRRDAFRIVLEIESQMNSRKLEYDKASKLVKAAKEANPDADVPESLVDFFESAEESFLNSIDRLCFCIIKKYIPDKDWKCEYRNLIHDTIKNFPESFNVASQYKNIIKLDGKWQDE